MWMVHPLPPEREPFASWVRLRAAHDQTGLIQAHQGYEVPGLLSWSGAVNYDFDAAHHVAVLRYWHERYGAELVTLTGDQIELLVARPPRDPATIAQLAVEMLGYCPDLDVLGTGMVAVLASEVVPRRSWSFWWD